MAAVDGADIKALNSTLGLNGRLKFEAHALHGPVAVLTAEGGCAIVALHGGQVLDWTPAGQLPVLWLSPVARLSSNRAARGGIPVCWPWFGPRPMGGDGQVNWPQHGFARTSLWSVCGGEADGDVVRLSLRLLGLPPDGVAWPHAAEVTLTIEVSETLALVLETVNRGASRIDLTQALHTYLRVDDIEQTWLEGLDGYTYYDAVTHGPAIEPMTRLELQHSLTKFEAEVNRVYVGVNRATIVTDPVLGSKIEVAKAGSTSTVVWNPWAVKGAALGDLGANGWRKMVCVETANTVYDPVRLAPGEHAAMQARLRVLSS